MQTTVTTEQSSKPKPAMIQKIIGALGVLVVMLILGAFMVEAQEPTATLSAETVPEEKVEATNQNIRDRIERVLVDTVGNNGKQQPKAIMGTIARLTTESVVVSKFDGTTETVVLDPQTVTFVQLTGNRVVSFSDLEIGSIVSILGFVDQQTFSARRVLIAPTTASRPAPSRETILGVIVELTSTRLTVRPAVVPNGGESGDREIPVNTRTVYRNDEGVSRRTELGRGDVVIVVQSENDSATSSAILVRKSDRISVEITLDDELEE